MNVRYNIYNKIYTYIYVYKDTYIKIEDRIRLVEFELTKRRVLLGERANDAVEIVSCDISRYRDARIKEIAPSCDICCNCYLGIPI